MVRAGKRCGIRDACGVIDIRAWASVDVLRLLIAEYAEMPNYIKE